MGATASVPKVPETIKVVQTMSNNSIPSIKFVSAVSTRKLDSFAQDMFLRSPKVEGLCHILSSYHGREAFMKFLRNEYAEANLWFYMAVEEMKKGYSGDDKEFAADTEIIFSTYLAPESDTKVHVSDMLRDNLQSMVSGEMLATQSEMLDVLIEAQDQAIQIMADSALPRFLHSESFQNWRDFEKCSAKALIEAQAESEGMGADETKGPVILKMSKELDKMLMSTSWLAGLLSSVESLPVCISLAAASETMRGFPLIYVNAAFENSTGYDRADVIGRNCKFLQEGKEAGHTSEPDSMARLSEALRKAVPVKVAITNFKKDGTPFRNLLAMKPIRDQDGNYAFVIGCQFDIGHKDATAKKMKMIDDLFKVLPQSVCTRT